MEVSSTPDMVVFGRVSGPYSLHGWVKIHFFGDDWAALGEMPQWWLGSGSEADAGASTWVAHELDQLKLHGKSMIAKLVQVSDRNAAEAIDGFYIAAPRTALPKTAANEYYWADLIGLDVVNVQDELLGQVVGLMSSGAHDVLSVKDGDGRERLLPFVAQVVKSVDAAQRQIRVEWGLDW